MISPLFQTTLEVYHPTMDKQDATETFKKTVSYEFVDDKSNNLWKIIFAERFKIHEFSAPKNAKKNMTIPGGKSILK
jgi:hypothetical protein